jgi:hypothetical protein
MILAQLQTRRNERNEPRHLTNRSSQPLAVPIISFQMTSLLGSVAKLGLASGG